jgi:hypothetical protein
MSKRISFFAFLLWLAIFRTVGAQSKGPTPTPIVVPPEIQAATPAGCKVAKIQEGDLRGLGPSDLLVFYETHPPYLPNAMAVFSREGGHYSFLWKYQYDPSDIGGMDVELSGPYRLDPSEKASVLLIGNVGGASMGSGLLAFHWDGTTFQKVPPDMRYWGFDIRDLGGDGKKELILGDRYMEDKIYEYEKGRLVLENASFPQYYAQGKNDPKWDEAIPQWLEDLRDPDTCKQAAYALRLLKFKNEKIIRALLRAARDENPIVRDAAMDTLGATPSRAHEIVPVYMKLLQRAKTTEDRKKFIGALGGFETHARKALPLLESFKRKYAGDPDVQKTVDNAISRIKGEKDPAYIE